MLTIEQMLEHLGTLDKKAFAKQFDHPFLFIVLQEPFRHPSPTGFNTAVMTADNIQERIANLQKLQAQGKRLSVDANMVRIFKLKKSSSNPYKNRISVGRTASADVVIPDSRISKLHACFEFNPKHNAYEVYDVGSQNGTKVNGKSLATNEKKVINYGDQLSFGDFVFQYYDASQLYDEAQKYFIPA